MLSAHSLRMHCAFYLYLSLHQNARLRDFSDPFSLLRACVFSIRLDVVNSLQQSDKRVTIYNCAIAHQVSPKLAISAEQLASELCERDTQVESNGCGDTLYWQAIADLYKLGNPTHTVIPLPSLQLVLRSQGWIAIEISWADLATWLDTISRKPWIVDLFQFPHRSDLEQHSAQRSQSHCTFPSTDVGQWQYTHARCCSILRQAEDAGFIHLSPSETAARNQPKSVQNVQNLGFITSPTPVPWCHLIVHDTPKAMKAERDLLLSLITGMDTPLPTDSDLALRRLIGSQIQRLCSTFAQFDARCRIWEPALDSQLELAQARLGLTSLTQQYLNGFMQHGLGLKTPLSL